MFDLALKNIYVREKQFCKFREAHVPVFVRVCVRVCVLPHLRSVLFE